MRSHAAFAVLFIAASAAMLVFTRQPGIASMLTDEVSYLALARLFAGGEPWAPFLTTFPPLFPMLLAATGAAHDLARAHAVVAACAILALPLVYRYGQLRLPGRVAPLVAAAAFLLTPAAWIGAKAILSEPAYLLASLGCIVFFEARAWPVASLRDRWLLAILIAVAVSLRSAGLMLVAAYIAHLAVRAVRREPLAARDAIPVLLPLAAVIAWMAMRPMQGGGDLYVTNLTGFALTWWNQPAATFVSASRAMMGGWIASFALDSAVPLVVALVLAALGVLALAGTWMRVRANGLDGWYVALSLALLLPIFFGEQTARRYLYPLVPLLLVHAGVALAAITADLSPRARKGALAAAIAVPLAISAASMATVANRAMDGAVVLEGFPIRYSDMIEYYTTRDEVRARLAAAENAGVIAGFDAVAQATPAGARVMWVRPEYVSVLSHRAAEPWFFDRDTTRLAQAIDERGVDYVIVAGIVKSDLAGARGDQRPIHEALARFALPVLEIPNAVHGRADFILLKVDRTALRAFLTARA